METAMQAKKLSHYWLIGCIGVLCLCGKAEKQEILYGPDSLNIGKLRMLMAPDASPADSVSIRQTLFRYSLAKMFSNQAVRVDSAAIKLARRMTLESGKEWSPEAASLLLHAASALEAKIRNNGIASVIPYVDSVLTVIDNRSIPGSLGKGQKFKGGFAWLDTIDLTNGKTLKRIISAVFGVSPEMASTVASFVASGPQSARDTSVNIDKMVRGILSKNALLPVAASNAGPKTPELEQEKSKNALLALKFRSQESIRDSIARHLPDLQLIYKKQLKLNEMSGGLVWVVFEVDADGRVLSAKIKSSAIANRQFQQLLEEYVRTIHFKAIPKDMEPMIFEFPFEFKSEGS